MAENVSVRLSLQDDVSSKLQQVVSASRSATSSLNSVGKSLDNAFRSSSINSFAATASGAFDSAISGAENLANTVNEAFDSMGSFGSGFGNLGEDFDDIADGMNSFADSIPDIGDALGDMSDMASDAADSLGDIADGADGLDEVADGANEAGSSLGEMTGASDRLASSVSNLIKIVSGLAILHEVGEYASKAMDDYADYEKGMAEVSTLISDSNGTTMAKMEEQTRAFATETGRLTTDIVPALYQAISASVPQENVFSFLDVANKAATGGVTDLETAVDGLTSIVNAYGQENMEVGRASDVMFTAVKLGKTNFEQMSSALFNVVPTAVNAGVAFEDVAAGIATITASGTPTSVATTQMRQALVELADETKGAGQTFQSVAGKSFREFVSEGGNVSEALNLMDDYASSAGKTIGQLFSSVEAANAAAGLTGVHAETYANDIEAMGNAAGATEEAYSKMADTFSHKKDLLEAAWEDIRLDSGDALVEAMEPAVESFLDNMDSIKEPIVGLFSSIGDLISAFAPMLPGAIDGFTGALNAFGKVVSPMFKMMSDNPDAVGTAVSGMATGLLSFKALNTGADLISVFHGAEKANTGLGKLASTLISNPWALGAAAFAGASIAMVDAMNKMEQAAIKSNIDEHFGDIHLDTSQVEALAGQIIPVDFIAELNLAGTKFEQGEQLVSDAESIMEENKTIMWKIAEVGLDLTEADKETLISNKDQFISDVTEALTANEQGSEMVVNALLGGDEAGQNIINTMQGWFTADKLQLDNLSTAMSGILQSAIESGVMDVNVETAVSLLQQKMLDMVNGYQQSYLQGKFDWLGISEGKSALDSDSWQATVEKVGEYIGEMQSAEEEQYSALFGQLRQYAWNDPSRTGEVESIIGTLGTAIQKFDAGYFSDGWSKMFELLQGAYGEEIDSAFTSMEGKTDDAVSTYLDYFDGMMNGSMGLEDLYNGFENYIQSMLRYDNFGSEEDRKAVLDRFGAMLPITSELEKYIDEATGPIPQAIMDSYYEAMELGASAGDEGAFYNYFAHQIAESFGGDHDSFTQMLEAAGITQESLGTQMNTALERAFKGTTDFDMSSFTDQLQTALANGASIEEIEGMFNQYGLTLGETAVEAIAKGTESSLNYSDLFHNITGFATDGAVMEVDGSDFMQFTVNSGDTVWKLAEQLLPEGTADSVIAEAVNRIAEASGNIDPNVINPEQVLTVPMDIALAAGEVDNSGLTEAAQSAADDSEGTASIAQQTDVTLTAGTMDTSGLTDTMQETADSAMETGLATEGTVDVLLDQTNNIDQVYSDVSNAAKSAFNSHIAASGTVDVTLNWHITNPTASISTSISGGTATATIAGAALHAEGGIFDTPHYGVFAEAGPEAFIPIDGSDNAKGIWQEVGERLGMFNVPAPRNTMSQPTQAGSAEIESISSTDKNINLNINGSGKMNISSGMSKSDVVQVMMDRMKDVLMNIVQTEILEEGDGVYEY